MTDTTSTEVQTFLSADDILAADDLKTEVVDVPEWGGAVRVRALSGQERDDYVGSLRRTNPKTGQVEPNNTNATAKLVARSIFNLDGTRTFNDSQIAALGRKSGGALARVERVANRLSGFGAEAEKDAEGNSEATPSDGSTSSEQTPPESQ